MPELTELPSYLFDYERHTMEYFKGRNAVGYCLHPFYENLSCRETGGIMFMNQEGRMVWSHITYSTLSRILEGRGQFSDAERVNKLWMLEKEKKDDKGRKRKNR